MAVGSIEHEIRESVIEIYNASGSTLSFTYWLERWQRENPSAFRSARWWETLPALDTSDPNAFGLGAFGTALFGGN